MDRLNISLFEFLDQRPSMNRGELSYDDVDSPWVALLFAVLALGVQFSDDPIMERDLRSKVFSTFDLKCRGM
jgi:predicted alternative tryptophan synthase beta-subunit